MLCTTLYVTRYGILYTRLVHLQISPIILYKPFFVEIFNCYLLDVKYHHVGNLHYNKPFNQFFGGCKLFSLNKK